MEMGGENTRKIMKMMVDDGNGERKHKKNDENDGGLWKWGEKTQEK